MGEGQQGRVYLSQNVLCFGARLFGLDIKQTLPWRYLHSPPLLEAKSPLRILLVAQEEISKKHSALSFGDTDAGSTRITAATTTSPVAPPLLRYVLTFDGAEAAQSAHRQLTALYRNHAQDSNNTPDSLTQDSSSTAPPLSFIANHVRTHVPHRRISDVRLALAKNSRALRLSGPHAASSPSLLALGHGVAAGALSAYPRLSSLDAAGKLVLTENQRQGDPICDQFAIDVCVLLPLTPLSCPFFAVHH